MSVAKQILKNFNLFVDGRGYAGNADEVQLPPLTIQTEDYRAAGMDSSVALDMGMEKLEASFKLSKYDKELLMQWGLVNGNTIPIVFRGALEDLDGVVQPVVVTMRGTIKTLEWDTVTPGTKAGMSCTLDLRYYRYQQNGEVLAEIDIINMKRIIGGVDRLAQIRAAIGI